MAEIVGLVIGGISMATLVDTCLKTFDLIESGRTYGRDYQNAALRLSLLQLRLSRWVESVIETVKQQNLQIGNSRDARLVQHLLGEIIHTIEETEIYARRHNTTVPTQNQHDEDKQLATMDKLVQRVKKLVIHQQKTASVGKKTRWAIRDRQRFNELLSDLATMISELEQLFPPIYMRSIAETRKALAKSEAEELVQPSEIEEPIEAEVVATILEDVAADVDEALNEEVKNVVRTHEARHIYGEINVGDNVRIFIGDYVASGEKKSGPGHIYRKLNASGSARIHYGDSFGKGKSVFDD